MRGRKERKKKSTGFVSSSGSLSFFLPSPSLSPLERSSCRTVPDSSATRRGTVSRNPSAETSVTRDGEEVDGADASSSSSSSPFSSSVNDASSLETSAGGTSSASRSTEHSTVARSGVDGAKTEAVSGVGGDDMMPMPPTTTNKRRERENSDVPSWPKAKFIIFLQALFAAGLAGQATAWFRNESRVAISSHSS